MNVNDPSDPLLPPPPTEGHHRSARERQRRGPMWGCLKAIGIALLVVTALLILIFAAGWWYLGTTNFKGLVKARVEETLESRLGREVTIGSVEIVRTRPQKIILNELTIANAPGGIARHFATVRQIEIVGGIESFWGRRIKVARVDIRQPRLWFEVFPEGSLLAHNFPRWSAGPKQPREIVHLEIGTLFIANGGFGFLDRKHDIEAVATDIDSRVNITRAENLYEGVMRSPLMRVRLQDYETFDVGLRGGFRYTPGILALRSIAVEGSGIEAFLSGKLDPLTEAAYDLRLTSRFDLQRIREIFRIENALEGTIALDTNLRGKQSEFRLAGGWATPRLIADAYELTDAKGRLDVNSRNMTLDVETAGYGGGTINAHYTLAKYTEPFPMRVDLRYSGIAIEQLFNDWTVENTGLRGAATGQLTYRWNKEQILQGAGEGTARLTKNAVAFSRARYPIPIAGRTDFAIDRGVVRFRSAELDTSASHVSLAGTLRIEDLATDLSMTIRSSDFSELDRIGYNFARAAGKGDYDLLGLGGSGTISGSVRGKIDRPQVVATIAGVQTRYNEVVLGDADIALRYDGDRSALTFERASFALGTGSIRLTGAIEFPDRGPGPRIDIVAESRNYPAQRAIDAVGLELSIGEGLATGTLIVTGTPETGQARFAGLIIRRGEATLALNGTINWYPGEGNVAFDLDIAANNFPVADIASFLDFADLPISGELTGTLKIAGRKESLEGEGRVTVRKGTILGEPVDLASAELSFSQGRMRATNVLVQSPAGEIRGEAELDLAQERFSYTISSSSINLSRLQILSTLADLFGGNVILKSTGAGTFDQPELVVEATLEGATLQGLALPAGSPPPSLYLAIRDGRLIVRGAVADIATIEGEGSVGENMAIDGLVRIEISDLARAAALSPATQTIPASGSLTIDLRLGGRLTPIEALVIEATVPKLDLRVADHEFTEPEPLRVALRNGRIEFDSFELRHTDSGFAVAGSIEIAGAKRIDLNVRGQLEAALLQLFTRDVRADGRVDLAVAIGGTTNEPRILGTAEFHDAQVKFVGFPQLIDQIHGTLRFGRDRVDIESLRATIGGGTVVAGGFVELDGMTPRNIRVTLQGRSVAIRYYEGLTLESNFALLLTGDLSRAILQGDVDVTRALYFRDFDVQQALLNVILARDRVAATAATWQDSIGLRIHLSAPGTLAVRNNIAEVTGSAELDVTGTLANPVILGELTLDEGGLVRIQNVDYRVARGTIAFQNPFRIDPFFDVTVEGTVSGFGTNETEGGPYAVTVNLTGTLDRLTPTITSDPPASDITLFSILGFGGIGSRDASQQAGGVGMLGQSLLYQSLGTLIGSRVFPFVDSFSYDPGTLETGLGAGAKVSFEKRLSNKIRFLIVYNLENQQSRQVVEWLVNPTWTLQLTRDETDEYRLDARFRRRYEGYWSFGRDEEESFATGAVMRSGAAPAAFRPSIPPVTNVNTRAADARTIAQINFVADARFDTTAVAQEVTLKPGQPVTIRELQSSIKNLFATESFRDIRVDATPAPSGPDGSAAASVVLTFSLFLHYRIDDIEIEGLDRGERARAQRELAVRRGEILSLDAVDDSAAAVQEMLREDGYLEASVDPETNFDRARNAAGVTLHVTKGPRAKIANVILDGKLVPFTTQQLIGRMKRGPGDGFHVVEAREDADRMKNFLVRRDYRRADVDLLGHQYDPASQSVTLRYRVAVGPIVQVAVTGVDRRAVRRWLPFARNQEYSEDAIDQAADRIVEGLQQRGHYLATVDTESNLEENIWTTTFHVNPGLRYRLASVTFSGNRQVNEDDLHDIVTTTPRGGFRRFLQTLFRRPAGVTRKQLSDDRDALETYYRLQGFSEATVAEPAVVPRADGTITIDFPITEGPQTLISELRIEGNEKLPEKRLPDPQLEEGAPLNPQLLHDDIVALQTFYASRGHVEVQVAPRVQLNDDKTAATVTYLIAEGPRVDVDEVIVRGNTYTNRDVVLRKANVQAGDPFSYTSMLEAQRELYRLGIFQRVEVQPQQTDTTVSDRDVVISVEEGRNLTLTGSIGLRADRGQNVGSGTTFHERIALAAAHRNLFGSGRYLGIEAVYGGREEQEAFLTYREPFISRWNVPVQVQIFQSDDSTRYGTTILQRGLSIEATKVARLATRWSTRYEYKISECERGEICDELRDNQPVEGIDPALRTIQISSLTPTFFWDRRDDIIDPHRGFFASASIEYAFPLFSATAGFTKEFLQGAFYLPVSERTVLALSGRVGFIQPYARGDLDEDGIEELLTIPLSERFTAGGETTHRAFALDRLGDLCLEEDQGPMDPPPAGCERTLLPLFGSDQKLRATLPLGGNSLLLFNAEYRFPIVGTFGGAVFTDIGNVFAGSGIDIGNLRYGGGMGFRYLSPVGPLRVDIAMPFDRRWYEDSFQYFITLGYAF